MDKKNVKKKEPEDNLAIAKEILYDVGYQHYQKGVYDKALKYFQFLVTLESNNERYLMALGHAFQMEKQFEEAAKTYAAISLFFPENASVHFHAAECFFALKKPESGIQAILEGFAIVQKHPEKKEFKTKEFASMVKKFKLLKETWEQEMNRIKGILKEGEKR